MEKKQIGGNLWDIFSLLLIHVPVRFHKISEVDIKIKWQSMF